MKFRAYVNYTPITMDVGDTPSPAGGFCVGVDFRPADTGDERRVKAVIDDLVVLLRGNSPCRPDSATGAGATVSAN